MITIDDDLPECWPRAGHRLFVENCWAVDAEIATFPGERLYRMKTAFKTAADLLVDRTEEAPHERRNLVWPIVFCYRQYVELALKDAIADHGSSLTPEVKPDCSRHRLELLWKSYKKLIDAMLLESVADDLPEVVAVEACITEFDGVDAGSYAFRYPTDTKGKQIEIPLESIDLLHLRSAMEGLHLFFDANESALGEHFQPSSP